MPPAFNVLSFFTIQSLFRRHLRGNLAWRLHRPGGWFRTPCDFFGAVAITITGVVFHLALADLQELDGTEAAVDWILHNASPVLCVLGVGCSSGPAAETDRAISASGASRSRGVAGLHPRSRAVVEDRSGGDYYLYPFLDVVDHGYARVAVNIGLVVVSCSLSSGRAVDRRLLGRRAAG